jgi:hypothetical protein
MIDDNTNGQSIISENAKSVLKHRIVYAYFKKYVLGTEPNHDLIIKTYSLFKYPKTLLSIAVDHYKSLTKGRSKGNLRNSAPSPIKYRERTPSKRNMSIIIKKNDDPEVFEFGRARSDELLHNSIPNPENIIQIQLLLQFVIRLIEYNVRNNICSKADIVELIINMNNNSESKENIMKITGTIKGTCYEQAVKGICSLFKLDKTWSDPISNHPKENLDQKSPNPIPKKTFTYKDTKPILFASELTRICQNYYSDISSYHLIDHAQNFNPFIQPLIDLWDKISNLVSSEIIYGDSESSQVFTVSYFVKVADELYNMGNYHMLFSILAGLGNASIGKLEYLWKNKPYLSSFHKLNNVVSFSGNFQNYRQEISLTTKPIIPYVGIILADFVHLLECNIFNYETETLNENIIQAIYKYCCTIDSYNISYDLPSINHDLNFYIDNLQINDLDDTEKPPSLSDSKKRSKSFEQKPNKPISIWIRKNASSIELNTPRK